MTRPAAPLPGGGRPPRMVFRPGVFPAPVDDMTDLQSNGDTRNRLAFGPARDYHTPPVAYLGDLRTSGLLFPGRPGRGTFGGPAARVAGPTVAAYSPSLFVG